MFFYFFFLAILHWLRPPMEKAMATHSSTLAWEIPWMEEPGRLQSMGSQRIEHDWATSLSLFTFMHWRRKWQPTPVFLPGESQGREPGGLPSMGSHRVGHNWCDLAAAAARPPMGGDKSDKRGDKSDKKRMSLPSSDLRRKEVFHHWVLFWLLWYSVCERERERD